MRLEAAGRSIPFNSHQSYRASGQGIRKPAQLDAPRIRFAAGILGQQWLRRICDSNAARKSETSVMSVAGSPVRRCSRRLAALTAAQQRRGSVFLFSAFASILLPGRIVDEDAITPALCPRTAPFRMSWPPTSASRRQRVAFRAERPRQRRCRSLRSELTRDRSAPPLSYELGQWRW